MPKPSNQSLMLNEPFITFVQTDSQFVPPAVNTLHGISQAPCSEPEPSLNDYNATFDRPRPVLVSRVSVCLHQLEAIRRNRVGVPGGLSFAALCGGTSAIFRSKQNCRDCFLGADGCCCSDHRGNLQPMFRGRKVHECDASAKLAPHSSFS